VHACELQEVVCTWAAAMGTSPALASLDDTGRSRATHAMPSPARAMNGARATLEGTEASGSACHSARHSWVYLWTA
jgi:hypothetical protein